MTFDEILDQTLEMLQRRGRVSYRALKRQPGCVGSLIQKEIRFFPGTDSAERVVPSGP